MNDELREKAIHFLDCRDYFEEEFAYRPPHAYDKEMLLDHFTDFAAECVRAEQERADRLNAALVEIEQRYIANPNGCPSCYDLASIATLNKEI